VNLGAIQAALVEADLDGWLFFDFRGSDPIAAGILGLTITAPRSRRWLYFVPAAGEPAKIVHAIETGALDELPGVCHVYLQWQRLHEILRQVLAGRRRVAMQYSPMNAIPYVSRVDAGTIELVRSFGIEVVSSADLVQQFESVISTEQWQTHLEAATILGDLVRGAFGEIGRRLRTGEPTTEFDIQQWICAGFERNGLTADHPPIVAVDANSADPHYFPTPDRCHPMSRGQFVLIDLWAKQKVRGAIYADITWTGYTGPTVPRAHRDVFSIVRSARDAAIDALQRAQSGGIRIRGCDIDDVCRAVIVNAGYGENFIHRTGHSIHVSTHGNGANIDNLETRDERRLIPRTVFSIEPGIYLPGQFGIRSEVNVFLPDAHSIVVSGPEPQTEILVVE
jgi:Xaa-Pro aminopeptidase